MPEYDDFVTNDMGLVAYLKLEGYDAQRIEYDGEVCRWRYIIMADLLDAVEAFTSEAAVVNPREYNRAYAQVKKEFHKRTDAGPNI